MVIADVINRKSIGEQKAKRVVSAVSLIFEFSALTSYLNLFSYPVKSVKYVQITIKIW